jgi:hypothetical protein
MTLTNWIEDKLIELSRRKRYLRQTDLINSKADMARVFREAQIKKCHTNAITWRYQLGVRNPIGVTVEFSCKEARNRFDQQLRIKNRKT